MRSTDRGTLELVLTGTPIAELVPARVEIARVPVPDDGWRLVDLADPADPTGTTDVADALGSGSGSGSVEASAELDPAALAAASPASAGLRARWEARRIGGRDVWECTLRLRNTGPVPLAITRMDSLALRLDPDPWTLDWYRSAWGDEWRPRQGSTRHDVLLDVRAGRSSHGTSPYLRATRERGDAAVVVSPAWSGNWHVAALAGGDVAAGISPWQLEVVLAPGEEVTAPSVVLAVGADAAAVRRELQRAVRDDWMPRTPASDAAPTEWNHWWPYEDAEVTHDVIVRNARVASRLGLEVATTDAGWFGASDAASVWTEQRGDWWLVNSSRFPGGLTALGEDVRAQGVAAGVWIEAEAVGAAAELRHRLPEAMAHAVDGRRHDPSYRLMTVSLDPDDPTFLGYVCLGSSAGRDHVEGSIAAVIEETGATWLKLDFNVDPDAGCTRTDHGHGAGDGLLRHYEGLYDVLDRIRARFPDLVLEACSSGGLRLDLGLARHVHCFFLSDPDHTEHHLQVLDGAAQLLPPSGILHWSWSQWRGDYPPARLDWEHLTPDRLDLTLRAAMLHRFGVSLRLDELRPDLLERVAAHVATFRSWVQPMLTEATLEPLTAPPQRGGLGERSPALQLSRTGSGSGERHVVAGFRLDPEAPAPGAVPVGLAPGRRYRCSAMGVATTWEVTAGDDLLAAAPPEVAAAACWLVLVEPADPTQTADPAAPAAPTASTTPVEPTPATEES